MCVLETKRKRNDPDEVRMSKGVEWVANKSPTEGHHSGDRPIQDLQDRYEVIGDMFWCG